MPRLSPECNNGRSTAKVGCCFPLTGAVVDHNNRTVITADTLNVIVLTYFPSDKLDPFRKIPLQQNKHVVP